MKASIVSGMYSFCEMTLAKEPRFMYSKSTTNSPFYGNYYVKRIEGNLKGDYLEIYAIGFNDVF